MFVLFQKKRAATRRDPALYSANATLAQSAPAAIVEIRRAPAPIPSIDFPHRFFVAIDGGDQRRERAA
ncbi:MAG: hypothetical protein ABI589_10085 [Burkholderiales bacterium]